jgi:hypothetical protein
MDQAFKPQKSSSATYHVLSQDQFTAEHRKYIDGFRETFKVMSKGFKQCNMSIIDTSYRTITLTDGNAKRCGFDHAKQAEDVLMYDYRCDAAQDADLWERDYKKMLACAQVLNKENFHLHRSETMGVYYYPNGIGFQIFRNYYQVLLHQESSSILGYMYQAMSLLNSLDEERQNILLAYIHRFNLMGTLRLHVEQPEAQRLPSDLSDEEHALCFFTLLGWGAREICAFLNKHGMRSLYGSSDSEIQARRHTLAQRLGVSSGSCEDLVDYLVAHDVHRMLPVSFFSTMDRPIPLALCTASQRSRMC